MTDIKEMGSGVVVEKTGSGSYPVVDFDISGVKYSGSANRMLYVVQSIISWNGRIVALSCIAANTRSHEMVTCPFFYRPRKKQLRAYCVFRKNAIVVKGSFLRVAKSRMSQFEQRENVNFCQKLGHILPSQLISQHAISFSFTA
jgi:hypothetical protein